MPWPWNGHMGANCKHSCIQEQTNECLLQCHRNGSMDDCCTHFHRNGLIVWISVASTFKKGPYMDISIMKWSYPGVMSVLTVLHWSKKYVGNVIALAHGEGIVLGALLSKFCGIMTRHMVIHDTELDLLQASVCPNTIWFFVSWHFGQSECIS